MSSKLIRIRTNEQTYARTRAHTQMGNRATAAQKKNNNISTTK